MTITRKKGSMNKVYTEDAEILISREQDQLIREIGKFVSIMGSSANEFGILLRVAGSPNEIQQAKALANQRYEGKILSV